MTASMSRQAEVINLIQKSFPELFGLYLFGSTATQQNRPDSDLDLAILMPQTIDSVALWKCAQTIASHIGQDVDLIDLQSASTVFRAQVMQSGKRILTVDELACQRFEMLAISMYLHLNEERAEIVDAIHRDKQVLG